jgi:hypothetical protein
MMLPSGSVKNARRTPLTSVITPSTSAPLQIGDLGLDVRDLERGHGSIDWREGRGYPRARKQPQPPLLTWSRM